MKRLGRYRTRAVALTAVLALTACSTAAEDPSGPSSTTRPTSSATTTTKGAQPPSSSSVPTSSSSSATSADTVAWPKGKPVPHLFFHSLVVDPQRALDGDDMAQGYEDYMITVTEFERILTDLLERDYVLVEPHDIATVGDDGTMRYRTLELPKGTTPLVLSLDDLSYYDYMSGDGFAERLVLHEGRVRNVYVDAEGKKHVGAHDVVPILDDFVAEHPEFSHEGAKGVIAMTGYDGVLGYRTSARGGGGKQDVNQERAAAKRVADAMKEQGWSFASHTWGHIDTTNDPLSLIKADQERWAQEVEPIVDETDMLIYPFGADIAGVATYSGPKYDYLASQGYDYFFNVDGTGPWQQRTGGYLRQGRMNVDGILLRANASGKSDSLKPFMDVDEVLDDARR